MLDPLGPIHNLLIFQNLRTIFCPKTKKTLDQITEDRRVGFMMEQAAYRKVRVRAAKPRQSARVTAEDVLQEHFKEEPLPVQRLKVPAAPTLSDCEALQLTVESCSTCRAIPSWADAKTWYSTYT